MDSQFFNAQHAPVGAFASFTLGQKGASGGIGLELAGPARQDIPIGCECEQENHFEALPFFTAPVSERERFGLTDTSLDLHEAVTITPFPDNIIRRDFKTCCDTWRAGALSFSVYSRAPDLPDPDDPASAELLKEMLLPGVLVEMSIDNRNCSHSRRAFFGFTGKDPYSGMRCIDTGSGVRGVGQGRHCAIYTDATEVVPGIGFSAEAVLAATSEGRLQGGLGDTGLLVFSVPPGIRQTFRCVICFFREGIVTSQRNGRYFYLRYFSSIDEVGGYALDRFERLKTASMAEEETFECRHLEPARAFMLSQAVRSYYGSTELLDTDDGPLWIVNEGEYRMINTLDLVIDHLFYEITKHPWTLRNVLDRYLLRYSFDEQVQVENGYPAPGGIAFTHDMGVANIFAHDGRSAYEHPETDGCFSYMTHEELLNWVIVAMVYALKTDDRDWMCARLETFHECLLSLINRDHPEEEFRSGMLCHDTVAVGKTGLEITTYDSLDRSLGQARGNSYVTVKRWAAFLLLNRMFTVTENHTTAQEAYREAVRCAETIRCAAGANTTIPALLDGSSTASLLPLVEGVIYPWMAGMHDVFRPESSFAPFLATLKNHLLQALSSEVHRIDGGGWKLSSSSDITWLSKLYLCRFIATEFFGMKAQVDFEHADEVYRGWLLDENNSLFAWSDQFKNGAVIGSRYYPRGVTAILWLLESVSSSSSELNKLGH